MSVAVRAPEPSDAAAIAEVHVRAWQSAYADIAPADKLAGLSIADRTTFWTRVLGDPSARDRHRLGLLGDRVAGFIAFGPARDSGDGLGEVWALNVHPAHWSNGVGKALMDAALPLLLAEHEELILWVAEQNERARTFYEHLGWRADGGRKRDQLWGIEFEEVRYRLTP